MKGNPVVVWHGLEGTTDSKIHEIVSSPTSNVGYSQASVSTKVCRSFDARNRAWCLGCSDNDHEQHMKQISVGAGNRTEATEDWKVPADGFSLW